MEREPTYSVRLTHREIADLAVAARGMLRSRAEQGQRTQAEQDWLLALIGKLERHRDSIKERPDEGSLI